MSDQFKSNLEFWKTEMSVEEVAEGLHLLSPIKVLYVLNAVIAVSAIYAWRESNSGLAAAVSICMAVINASLHVYLVKRNAKTSEKPEDDKVESDPVGEGEGEDRAAA